MKKLLVNLRTFILIAMATLSATTIANAQSLKPVVSGYSNANGLKTYYEVYGEGQPVVLLHGAFMTIEGNWGQIIPELAKTHKVIAIELQGHGHTPYSDRKLTHANLANDVSGVLDQLKIEKADVVGYSFGGTIAYEFAILHPTRLNKLVIISAAWKSDCWVPQIAAAFKGMKPEFLDKTPMHTAYDAVAPDKTKWVPFLQQMITAAQQPFDLGEANVAKISAPVLIISGDNDGMDKVELAKTYQMFGGGVSADMAPMPKSQLAVVPAQSHVSLMEQTPTILSYMGSFLK